MCAGGGLGDGKLEERYGTDIMGVQNFLGGRRTKRAV